MRALRRLGYEHIASVDAGDGRGIEQAVLSRFPVSGVVRIELAPLGESRIFEKEGTDTEKISPTPA